MTRAEHLTGAAYFAVTVGPVLLAATLLVRRRLAHLSGVPALLAFAILASAGLVAVHLLPGLAGLLSREVAALGALLLLAGVVLATRRPGAVGDAVAPGPRRRLRELAAELLDPVAVPAFVAVALVAAWSIATAWNALLEPSLDVDTLTFHLPNMVTWIQTGSVWRTDQFTPLLASGNYPQSGDVLLLSAVLPWDSTDAFVRAAGLPFVALVGLSVYALATLAGARGASAALAGAVATSIPALQVAAFEGAKTDLPMLGLFGAGTYFLMRQLAEPRHSHLVLAGLGLGLAFGMKWYALWSVPIVLLAWAALGLLVRRPWRGVAAGGGALSGIVAVTGGVWMVRNAVESGSPVYPSPVGFAGVTIFDAPRDFIRECAGFSIAGYLDDPGIVRDVVVPAWNQDYGGPGAVLLVGVVVATVLLVRDVSRGVPRERWAPIAALLATVPLLTAAYLAAPYSAFGAADQPLIGTNTRWLLPAAIPAGAATAWALSRMGRARPVLEVLALLAVADGLRREFDVTLGVLAPPAVGAAAAVAAIAFAVVLWRRGAVAARAGAVGVVAGVAAVALVAGDRRQAQFYDGRFEPAGPVLASLAASAEDHKIGLAGVWGAGVVTPVLAAFGADLDNEVSFVGPMIEGQQREHETRAAFLAAVRSGGYDRLVIGRGGYGPCELPGSDTDDDAWARSAGFRPLAETENLTLYAVPEGFG